MIGVDGQSLAELRRRFAYALQPQVRLAQVIVCIRVVRIRRQRLPVMLDGRLDLTLQ